MITFAHLRIGKLTCLVDVTLEVMSMFQKISYRWQQQQTYEDVYKVPQI